MMMIVMMVNRKIEDANGRSNCKSWSRDCEWWIETYILGSRPSFIFVGVGVYTVLGGSKSPSGDGDFCIPRGCVVIYLRFWAALYFFVFFPYCPWTKVVGFYFYCYRYLFYEGSSLGHHDGLQAYTNDGVAQLRWGLMYGLLRTDLKIEHNLRNIRWLLYQKTGKEKKKFVVDRICMWLGVSHNRRCYVGNRKSLGTGKKAWKTHKGKQK